MPRALRARGARVHLLRLKPVLAAEPSARMPREPRCDRLYGEIGDVACVTVDCVSKLLMGCFKIK